MTNLDPTQHESLGPREILASQEVQDEHLHVTPFTPMLVVFIALLILTVLTVITAEGFHAVGAPDSLAVVVAIIIASLKAFLVAGYFMHLKYDDKMNTAVVGSTIFAVVLFLGFTLTDLLSRPLVEPEGAAEITPGGTRQVTANAEAAAEQAKGNPDAAADEGGADH